MGSRDPVVAPGCRAIHSRRGGLPCLWCARPRARHERGQGARQGRARCRARRSPAPGARRRRGWLARQERPGRVEPSPDGPGPRGLQAGPMVRDLPDGEVVPVPSRGRRRQACQGATHALPRFDAAGPRGHHPFSPRPELSLSRNRSSAHRRAGRQGVRGGPSPGRRGPGGSIAGGNGGALAGEDPPAEGLSRPVYFGCRFLPGLVFRFPQRS